MKNKFLILGISLFVLVSLFFAGGVILDRFQDDLSSNGTITWTGAGLVNKVLNIPRYVEINDATINVSVEGVVNLSQLSSFTNTTLNGAFSVYVDTSNQVAYVASFDSNSITAINISNPNSMTQLSSFTNSTLSGAYSVYVDTSNQVAYVTSFNSDSITAINISNPSSMTQLSSFTNTTLSGAYSVYVDTSNQVAYVASLYLSSITAINIYNHISNLSISLNNTKILNLKDAELSGTTATLRKLNDSTTEKNLTFTNEILLNSQFRYNLDNWAISSPNQVFWYNGTARTEFNFGEMYQDIYLTAGGNYTAIYSHAEHLEDAMSYVDAYINKGAFYHDVENYTTNFIAPSTGIYRFTIILAAGGGSDWIAIENASIKNTSKINQASSNQTVYLDIPKFANVTSASLTLNGFDLRNASATYLSVGNSGLIGCYQESANTTNQTGIDGDCGLIYNGGYSGGDPLNYDGNWSSGTSWASTSTLYINYTIPEGIYGASFRIGQATMAQIIPFFCLDDSDLQIKVEKNTTNMFKISCRDNSSHDWTVFFMKPSSFVFHEEAINWSFYTFGNPGVFDSAKNINIAEEINSYLSTCTYNSQQLCSVPLTSHVSTDFGILQISNISVIYNNISKSRNFSDTLTSALNNGVCDCNGCSIVGNNCTINTSFYSSSAGTLDYNLFVNYSLLLNTQLDYPSNGSILNTASINFTANITGGVNVTNATVNIFNSTSLVNQTTQIFTPNLTVRFNRAITLPQGTYTWFVNSTDENGLSMVSENRTFILDLTNPNATLLNPANLSYINTSSYNLTANITDDFSGLKNWTINIFNSSGLYNQTIGVVVSSFQEIISTFVTFADGVYTWFVKVFDISGNSYQTDNKTFIVDTTKQILTFVSPSDSNNSYVNRDYVLVNASQTEVNPNNLTVYLYNTSLVSIQSTSNNINYKNFSSLSDGIYYYNATSVDMANNTNSSSTIKVTVDTTKPLISFVPGTENNNTNKSQSNVFINVSITDTNFKNVTFNLYNSTSLVSSSTYTDSTRTRNFTGLSDNTYYYNVTSCDLANNCNSTETRLIRLDTTAPVINILFPSNAGAYNYHNQTLNLSITDNLVGLSTCWKSLNSGTNTTFSCTSNTTVNNTIGTMEGSNKVEVWANDTLGHVGYSFITYEISTIKPLITLHQPSQSDKLNYKNNILFNFSAVAQGGRTLDYCDLYTNTTGTWHLNETFNDPSEFTQTYKNLTDGTYIWNVNCFDDIENSNWGNQNYSFRVDTTYPLISYGTNTESNNANLSRDWIYINTTQTELYFSNITFRLYNTTSLVNLTTYSTKIQNINFTSLPNAHYTYNVTTCDEVNNCNTTANRVLTLDTGSLTAVLTTPTNETYWNTNQNLSADITDNLGIKNASLYINGLFNQTRNFGSSVLSSTVSIVVDLADGVYTWFWRVFDWAGNSQDSNINTLTKDTTSPQISFISPTRDNDTNHSQNYVFVNLSLTEINFKNITYNLYDDSFNLLNSTNYLTTITSINWSAETDGIYYYNVTSCDLANNCNSTETRKIFLDDTSPYFNIILPLNINYGDNTLIPLTYNVFDTLSSVSSCVYSVSNSTGIVNSNVSLPNCENTTFSLPLGDVDYNITLYANDSLGNMNSTNIPFGVRTETPAVNLIPSNNTFYNFNNVTLNFTVTTNADNITKCELYNNFNGTWLLNQTFNNPNTSIINSFNSTNISEGSYIWNVKCYDNFDHVGWAVNNNTLTIDQTNPNLTLISPISTLGGLTFDIIINATDLNGVNKCYYNITYATGGGVFVGNTEIANCINTTETIIGTAIPYNLAIIINDSAGNINTTTRQIIYNTPIPPTGGGGGGGTVIVGEESGRWSMEVARGVSKYEKSMAKGTSLRLSIDFENLGTTSRRITLSCENTNGTICDYITFEENPFVLPLLKDTKIKQYFTIILPDDFKEGKYSFNIKALDDVQKTGFISVDLNTDLGGVETVFNKITTSTKSGFPYFLIWLIAFIISATVSSFVFRKAELRALWVILTSVVVSTITLFLF